MDAPPSAPPVVVVVVARDPGPWFEEALAAHGAQDYPNLSVLVIQARETPDLSRRVAAAVPNAYVRRIEDGEGFAALANDVLETVQGAAFLLFCHDDVAPDPDAVRRLVEEAFRSNAGVVGPKVVEWDRPQRLLDVGLSVDKTGASASLAERSELDQEQHDAVRDVFAVSSACMLVRYDLFAGIGGFDPAMTDYGADVDLCWRAQVAGARVLIAPSARVRHREEGGEKPGEDRTGAFLRHRNHLRSMFKNYSAVHLARVAPQAAVLTVGEILLALVRRRVADAAGLLATWWWNVRTFGRLRPARKAVRDSRAVADSDVRRLQVRGSVRVNTYLQRQLHAEDRARALVSAGQELVGAVGRGPAQVAAIVAGIVALVWLLGTRHLLGGPLPATGQLAPIPGPVTLFAHWASGWRTTGLGAAAPSPSALIGLAGASVLLLGKAALVQKLLVLGAWPLGVAGVWRLTRPFGTPLPRLVAITAYVCVPLPYNALARGRLDALVAYAALPWLVKGLMGATRLAPFGRATEAQDGPAQDGPEDFGALPRVWLRRALGLALGLAVAGSLAPSLPVAFLLAGVGILGGSLLIGGARGALRGLGTAATATLGAAVLLLPWTLEVVLPGPGWSTALGVAPDPAHAAGFSQLLRFQIGPMGAGVLGWALIVAAALPLVLGRGWRLEWAVRTWSAALVCVIVAWVGGRGWGPLRPETPDVLLVPAALALALAAALGAAAFERDLPRYRFGWRQASSVAAGAAVMAGVLPLMAGSVNGRWGLRVEATVRSLSWMAAEQAKGPFRVLWVGAPEALPLDGWPLGPGLAFATSRDGAPTFVDLLPGRASDATQAIAGALRLAEAGDTARLGRLLAPMAVRYLVLPTALATGTGEPNAYPLPDTLTRALGSQVDLRVRPSDPAVTVYENTSWGPGRALLTGSAGTASADLPDDLGGGADLSGGTPVLFSGRANRYRGELPSPGRVLVAEGPSGNWSLSSGGQAAGRQAAFGLANVFTAARAGKALLRYQTPLLHSALAATQVGLWLALARFLVRSRTRKARPGQQEAVTLPAREPVAVGPSAGSLRGPLGPGTDPPWAAPGGFA